MIPTMLDVRFVSLSAIYTDDGALREVCESTADALKFAPEEGDYIVEADERCSYVASCGQWVPYLPWAGGEA